MHADAISGRAQVANIYDIAPASHGRLWLASGTGLYRFDPATRALDMFRNDPRNARSLPAGTINRLHVDPDGTLWIATNHGLARWDGEGRGFTRFIHDPANPHSLGGDLVVDILRDHAGRLWVACLAGGGLSLYRDGPPLNGKMQDGRLQDGSFQVFHSDRNDPDSISQNDIWSLLEDRSGPESGSAPLAAG